MGCKLTEMFFSYKIGDSFMTLPLSEVQELLSSATTEIESEVSTLEEELGGSRRKSRDSRRIYMRDLVAALTLKHDMDSEMNALGHDSRYHGIKPSSMATRMSSVLLIVYSIGTSAFTTLEGHAQNPSPDHG